MTLIQLAIGLPREIGAKIEQFGHFDPRQIGREEIAQFRLEPLAGLVALERLSVSLSAGTDLSPLAGLSSCSTLDLSTERIDDLSPVAALTPEDLEEIIANAGPDDIPPPVSQGYSAMGNYDERPAVSRTAMEMAKQEGSTPQRFRDGPDARCCRLWAVCRLSDY